MDLFIKFNSITKLHIVRKSEISDLFETISHFDDMLLSIIQRFGLSLSTKKIKHPFLIAFKNLSFRISKRYLLLLLDLISFLGFRKNLQTDTVYNRMIGMQTAGIFAGEKFKT